MAVFPNAGIERFICLVKKVAGVLQLHFLSGFTGFGWKIWEHITGKFKLEIDDVSIRNTLIAYNLIISKIRSIVGAFSITQAQGTIKSVTVSEDNYVITLEDANSFMPDDFIRMMEFTGSQRQYWVKVSDVTEEGAIIIPRSEFEDVTPSVGDELVQFGNETNEARQSAIYLHVDEGGQPAIDLMFGINSKSFDGKVKLRLGSGLPGVDENFKGLYCENGMLRFTDAEGNVTACIYPNGSAEFGGGSAAIRADKSGFIGGQNGLSWLWDSEKKKFICTFGSDAVLQWDNLSDESKENLKGDPGTDANLLPWVEDFDNNQTVIDDESIISIKSFFGSQDSNGNLTGVAIGRDVITIDGVKRTGVFGLSNGIPQFILDPIKGEYYFGGAIRSPYNQLPYNDYPWTEGSVTRVIRRYKLESYLYQVGTAGQRVVSNKYVCECSTTSMYGTISSNDMILPSDASYGGLTVTIHNKATATSSLYVNGVSLGAGETIVLECIAIDNTFIKWVTINHITV